MGMQLVAQLAKVSFKGGGVYLQSKVEANELLHVNHELDVAGWRHEPQPLFRAQEPAPNLPV
jgi:hypothetical protein